MRNITKFSPISHLKAPILFLVFNRPDVTKKVFMAIREVRPSRLYVAADGARDSKEGEKEKVEEVRKFIMNNVDWDCKIETLFRANNVGCGPGVKSAIDWFFENEESGIILEDDCLPKQSFFWYCEELLQRYKTDERIGMISGNNHAGYQPGDCSYFFSKYKGCWGWATWKRAWKNMDMDMQWLKTSNRDCVIANMSYSKVSEKHWQNAIQMIHDGVVSAWDWQWFFSLAAQNQLCIIPKHNLVANIGFGEDATHTLGKPRDIFVQTEDVYFPLSHPSLIVSDVNHDKLYEQRKIKKPLLDHLYIILIAFVPVGIKNIIKKIWKKCI